jgi:hypothetical protein
MNRNIPTLPTEGDGCRQAPYSASDDNDPWHCAVFIQALEQVLIRFSLKVAVAVICGSRAEKA